MSHPKNWIGHFLLQSFRYFQFSFQYLTEVVSPIIFLVPRMCALIDQNCLEMKRVKEEKDGLSNNCFQSFDMEGVDDTL